MPIISHSLTVTDTKKVFYHLAKISDSPPPPLTWDIFFSQLNGSISMSDEIFSLKLKATGEIFLRSFAHRHFHRLKVILNTVGTAENLEFDLSRSLRRPIYDFLLVSNSNDMSIFHRLAVIDLRFFFCYLLPLALTLITFAPAWS